MKPFGFLLFNLLLSLSLLAQQERTFTRGQLMEDLDFLQESLQTYNPGLYNFTSKEQFQHIFNDYRQIIRDGMTDLDFFKIMSEIIVYTKEAHHTIEANKDTSTSVFKFLTGNKSAFFPLKLKFIDSKAYVWFNLSASEHIKRGDQLLSINKTAIGTLVPKLFKYIVSDGQIDTYKYHKLSKDFGAYYYWFIGQPQSFLVNLRDIETGKIKKITIPAATISEQADNLKKHRHPQNSLHMKRSFYDLRFVNSLRTAVLQLTSFDRTFMKSQKKAKKTYKKIFKKIKKSGADYLVLDLRDNTGGKKEFTYELIPFLKKSNQNGLLYTSTSWEGKTKDYHIPGRSKFAFEGTLITIVNGSTFSSGAIAAMFAQIFGKSTIIGEETGGRAGGVVAGSNQLVTMPNTKIKLRIPTYKWEFKCLPENHQKGRGVLPDISMHPNINDLIEGKDTIMEQVMERIGEERLND